MSEYLGNLRTSYKVSGPYNIWADGWRYLQHRVCPAKTQISRHSHAVWSESLLALWISSSQGLKASTSIQPRVFFMKMLFRSKFSFQWKIAWVDFEIICPPRGVHFHHAYGDTQCLRPDALNPDESCLKLNSNLWPHDNDPSRTVKRVSDDNLGIIFVISP